MTLNRDQKGENMDPKKLLPVGSVVLVKEANKKMMIIGILQTSEKTRYDYMAVLYPEGYLSQEHIYLFNHEDIEEIAYIGFMGAEHQVFRSELAGLLEKMDELDGEDS